MLGRLSAVWFRKHGASFEIDHISPEHRFSNVISRDIWDGIFIFSKPRHIVQFIV